MKQEAKVSINCLPPYWDIGPPLLVSIQKKSYSCLLSPLLQTSLCNNITTALQFSSEKNQQKLFLIFFFSWPTNLNGPASCDVTFRFHVLCLFQVLFLSFLRPLPEVTTVTASERKGTNNSLLQTVARETELQNLEVFQPFSTTVFQTPTAQLETFCGTCMWHTGWKSLR